MPCLQKTPTERAKLVADNRLSSLGFGLIIRSGSAPASQSTNEVCGSLTTHFVTVPNEVPRNSDTLNRENAETWIRTPERPT